ncbi:hypothetical protein Csa_012643 [Cucumis sativus]|uniref:Uncharacterized protein n=1 Tax=Cucumis sativus TaxID=3659 RepID=A0A0A0L157_CUCSA|nr:hypothetical protein Csa_012643 [Cucumis sativus]
MEMKNKWIDQGDRSDQFSRRDGRRCLKNGEEKVWSIVSKVLAFWLAADMDDAHTKKSETNEQKEN